VEYSSLYDCNQAGFEELVFIIRKDFVDGGFKESTFDPS